MNRLTALLLAGAATLSTGIPLNEANPPLDRFLPKPSEDTWYKPPAGWESTAPGTALRVRPHAYKTPPAFNYTDVVQVLFRTTDSRDRPTFSATTAFIPKSHATCLVAATSASGDVKLNSTEAAAKGCSAQLVSYQYPYDSSCFDTSPSWSLQERDPWGEINLGLSQGWFVAVPDYEGPMAAFGANIIAAHVILDSVRALYSTLGQFGFRDAPEERRVALWGYSSGGTATAWALELASAYAPDLKIDGGVVGGMTANQTESSILLNGSDTSGLLVQSLLGLTAQYPAQRQYLDDRLKETGVYNSSDFHMATTMSVRESLAYYLYLNVFQYFKGGFADVYTPEITNLMEAEGVAGRLGTPKMSVFVHHAIDDEMCPSGGVDGLVKKFCANGANIMYQRNRIGGHNRQLGNMQRTVVAYLHDVFYGRNVTGYPAQGCQIKTVAEQHDEDVPFY